MTFFRKTFKIASITCLFLAAVVVLDSCKKEKDDPAASTTPSSSTDNIKIGSTSYTNLSSKSCGVVSGKWRASCTYGSGYQIFIYTGAAATPSSTTSFTLIPPTSGTIPTLGASQAYIYCMNGSNYESFSGGTLSIAMSGGKPQLTLSNVTLRLGSASGFAIVVNMQLTCP